MLQSLLIGDFLDFRNKHLVITVLQSTLQGTVRKITNIGPKYNKCKNISLYTC